MLPENHRLAVSVQPGHMLKKQRSFYSCFSILASVGFYSAACCLMVARWLLLFRASHLTSKLRRKLWIKLKKNFFSPETLPPSKDFFSCPLTVEVVSPSLSSSHLVGVCCFCEWSGEGAVMTTFPCCWLMSGPKNVPMGAKSRTWE